MPDNNADNAAYAAAAAQVLSSGINYASAAAADKRGRKWAEEQYARQRADALSDWNMQNDYNSPASQMRRYKDAGLNAHLIYGQQSNTPTVRSSDAPSYKPVAPQVDVTPAVNSLFASVDLEMKQAQTDNLKKTSDVLTQDAILRAAQTAATVQQTAAGSVQTEQSKFNLAMAKNLETVSLEKANAELNKLQADTTYTLDQNERAKAQNAQTLAQGAENILSIRAQRAQTEAQKNQIYQQIENLKKDNQLKQLDINLKRNGIQPSDPAWQRILSQILSGSSSAGEIIKNMPDYIRDIVKPVTAKPGGWIK